MYVYASFNFGEVKYHCSHRLTTSYQYTIKVPCQISLMPGSCKALQAWLCAVLQLSLTGSATRFFSNTEVQNRSIFPLPPPSSFYICVTVIPAPTPPNLDKTVLRQSYNLDNQYY